jgi:hypothetical protein
VAHLNHSPADDRRGNLAWMCWNHHFDSDDYLVKPKLLRALRDTEDRAERRALLIQWRMAINGPKPKHRRRIARAFKAHATRVKVTRNRMLSLRAKKAWRTRRAQSQVDD